MRQLLAKAEARLADIGSTKDRMLFAAILLRDMDELAETNVEWDIRVADIAPPARACFEVRLANPALKVETIVVVTGR